MEEEVLKGNRNTTTFTKQSWKRIKEELYAQAKRSYTDTQLRNKYNLCRCLIQLKTSLTPTTFAIAQLDNNFKSASMTFPPWSRATQSIPKLVSLTTEASTLILIIFLISKIQCSLLTAEEKYSSFNPIPNQQSQAPDPVSVSALDPGPAPDLDLDSSSRPQGNPKLEPSPSPSLGLGPSLDPKPRANPGAEPDTSLEPSSNPKPQTRPLTLDPNPDLASDPKLDPNPEPQPKLGSRPQLGPDLKPELRPRLRWESKLGLRL
ncbi:hypothetical protein F8388_003528 [Cannabis sativa]|uniref:Myb/SANT-like domain-containing protein n=1 Tax=Cannabis sativa TaxID=3483 RepID=A0A7J6EMF0_CANSA|nr:hypothetical protein F8388_003528 [Cannabis sativa]